jgi:hypothetical protein
MTICIVLTLIIMAAWCAELMDVRGAFLHGNFDPKHKMYMYVPQGFERFYPKDVVLLLLHTIYGTVQAASAFWKKLLSALRNMLFKQSKADACLYFKWTQSGLVIFISWVNDMLCCGKYEAVQDAKQSLFKEFECNELGELKEYVRCRINRRINEIKITQPVLIQSFSDEFKLPGESPVTPALHGSQLVKEESDVSEEEHAEYQKGVGKLLHLVKYSCVDCLNRVRELLQYVSGPSHTHLDAMY